MDFSFLYSRRQGRISRKTFWMGAIGLGASGMLVVMVVGIAAFAIASNAGGPQAVGVMSIAFAGLLVLFSYPSYCLAVKRRHDRNNSGLDILILTVLNIVWGIVALAIMVLGSPETFFTSPLFGLARGIGQIGSLYAFVVLGCLEGTKGDNAYGPDPLADTPAAAPSV